jgi:hypothetical protein
MSFLSKLLLGNGKLSPRLRAALDSEGLVLIEEGLPGSIRYKNFKAPGRRFSGKVTPQVFGLAISGERLAVYCRSGRTKVVDRPFSDPQLSVLDVSLEGTDTVSIRIDFDRAGIPKVSGEMTIAVDTPNAATIVEELLRRLRR